jgi:hypothetical protein
MNQDELQAIGDDVADRIEAGLPENIEYVLTLVHRDRTRRVNICAITTNIEPIQRVPHILRDGADSLEGSISNRN